MADNIIAILHKCDADPAKVIETMSELEATSLTGCMEISNAWSQAMNAMTGPAQLLPQINTDLLQQLGIMPQLAEYTERIAQATQQMGVAKLFEASASELFAKAIVGEVEGLVSMIAGRRAAAAVLAVWDAAKAAEAFADAFMGDPEAFAAGIQYTLAATRYGLIAGGVGSSVGGASAAGRSDTGLAARAGRGYGYGSGGGPGVAPGSLAPGSTPAPGGQLTVIVMGEPTAAQWLTTNVLNPFVQRGGTLMASTAQRVPASSG
jgi:hypothetical protein